MKVPANLPADRLILDYLSRVAAASNRYLAKGKRIAFVGSTRKRIEREIGAAGMADPARVREVLARLGDPEDLVKAERARLDEERDRRLSRKHETGDADIAAVTAPLQFRPLNSRRKPIAQPRPLRPAPPAGQGGTGPQARPAAGPGAEGEGKRKGRLGGLLLGRQNRPEAQPEAPRGTQPGAPPSPRAGASSAGTAGQGPGSTAGQGPGGPARWTQGGAGTEAPGATVPLRPDGTGTRPAGGVAAGGVAAGGAGTGALGGAGTTASGAAGTPVSGGAGAPVPGEPGAPEPGEAGIPAPGETGTQPPGGISARALGSGGSGSVQQPSAGRVTPAAAGDARAGTAVPAAHGTAPGDTSPLSRGGATLRGATATLGRAAGRLALGAAELARQAPLETVAVLLLGVGGLLFLFYPIPFWLLGGLLALRSQVWNGWDKWVALAGPPVIALVGTVVTAMIIGGRGHAVTMYPHAFRLSVIYLLGAACVVCAVYLALQARRGPQRKLPPWKR